MLSSAAPIEGPEYFSGGAGGAHILGPCEVMGMLFQALLGIQYQGEHQRLNSLGKKPVH